MLEVGFEPTRTNTADLKSAPLDHSGIPAFHITLLYYNNVIFKYIFQIHILFETYFFCSYLYKI